MSETLMEAQAALRSVTDQLTVDDCEVWLDHLTRRTPLDHRPADQLRRLAAVVLAMRRVDEAWESIPNGSSVVYAIQGDGLTKIGTTKNLSSRLGALRAASPSPLELLGSCSGSNELEKSLHARFAAQRHHGEWFDLDEAAMGDLLDLMAEVGP